MKRFEKGSPICLPALLVVGLVAGWMVVELIRVTSSEAQRAPEKPAFRKIPASPGPPLETQQMEQEQKDLPPPPQQRSTVQELEQQLLNLPGGREMIEKARVNRRDKVIAASPGPPPEVQQLEEEQKQLPPPPQQRPTVQELEQQLLNLPGGREMIEKAKRGERPTGMKWDGAGSFLSWLNPFRVTEAEAGATFTLTLSHTLNASSQYNLYSSSPYGSVYIYGSRESNATPSSTWSTIPRSTKNWGDGTSETLQGYVDMFVGLPADGWYIVSLNASTSGSVSLRHYEKGEVYPVLQMWTLGNGYKNYPYIAYFAAGTHAFYWTFSANAYVTRMTVDSYP